VFSCMTVSVSRDIFTGTRSKENSFYECFPA
jgi:hypothetical protein